MKKLLFALTITVGLLAPLAPRAQAATDVSLNFFYDNLGSEGNWVEVGDYGYCFQPTVAVNNADWRPYADGYWAYTDVGWTWVSYEDFGWATYHYGRWSNLADYGWVWVPGYEWGPAWVSWRTGGDYIGWAPLPATAGRIYEGRAINAQVDVDYDIGPEYYNFVDIRYIGEPVLRGRIVQTSQNLTIINRTVNVTNITYNNSTVYNYGPSYERVNQYSTRPVQRLTLSRETTVANLNVQAGGGRNFNRVNGGQLMVVAPAIQRSQQRIVPKTVKTKIEKPTFERGWKGISNRQQIQAEMKKENAQNVPPPSFQPQKGRKAAAAPAAATETEQANPNQPNEANKADRRPRQQAPKANAAEANAPETAPNAENVQADQSQREAQRAKRQEKAPQSDANDNNAQPNETKPNEGARAAQRAARQNRQKANENSDNAPKAEAADKSNQDSAVDGNADRNSAREKMKNRREKRAQANGQMPDNAGNKGAAQADQPKANRAPADQEPNPQMDQRREKRAQANEKAPDNPGSTGADQADQPKAERAPASQEQNAQLDQRHEARQERRAARRANAESKPADQPEQARQEQARPEPRRAEPPSPNSQPEAAPQGNRAERNAPQNRPAARAQTPAQEKPAETVDDNTPRKPRKKGPNDENKPDQP